MEVVVAHVVVAVAVVEEVRTKVYCLTTTKFVLQWHITHKCNLRCKHCYQEEYSSTLTMEDCTKVINDFVALLKSKLQVGHINITGGEPLASPILFDLLDLIDKTNLIVSFGILTNGTLLTEALTERLSKYKKLSFVQISLDGTKEVHDQIRGEGSFNRAVNGLKLLEGFDIESMVAFTFHHDNYKEIKPLIKFCEKQHVDRFWADRYIPEGEDNLKIVNNTEFDYVRKVLVNESNKVLLNPFCKTKIHANRAMQGIYSHSQCGYKCNAGLSLLVITANGDILPCRRLPLKLGNIHENTLIEALTVSSGTISRIHEIPSKCRSCKYFSKCNGGAKCLTYAVNGKLNVEDVNCIEE